MTKNEQQKDSSPQHESTFQNVAEKAMHTTTRVVGRTADDAKAKIRSVSEHARDVAQAQNNEMKKRLIDKLERDVTSFEARKATDDATSGHSATDGSADSAVLDTDTVSTTSQHKPQRHLLRTLLPVAIIALIVVIVAYGLLSPGARSLMTKEDVETSSLLSKAVETEGLSSAEFVFNGIAEKKKDGTDETEFSIAYDATVKAGVRMSDIRFEIDSAAGTVTPILPEVVIGEPTLNLDRLDYLPSNPHAEIAEIISICKEDAQREAEQSAELRQVAEDNLHAIVEALTLPILKARGYTISWNEA